MNDNVNVYRGTLVRLSARFVDPITGDTLSPERVTFTYGMDRPWLFVFGRKRKRSWPDHREVRQDADGFYIEVKPRWLGVWRVEVTDGRSLTQESFRVVSPTF